MTGATYQGWTYDMAADKKADLDDGYGYLRKAIEALGAADFDTSALQDEVDEVMEQKALMNFYMAKTKQLEDDAGFRLGGDLS